MRHALDGGIPVLAAKLQLVVVAIGLAAIPVGCGRGNGLPGDLKDLLARNGIAVHVRGFEAPLSSRAGFVFFDQDPAMEAMIVARFNLQKTEPDSADYRFISARVPGKPKDVWGIAGRPAKLKLDDGGQLEYLYLITTSDGRTYLAAEYAYG